MKIVETKDILEFVMAQPDDRPVDMGNNVANAKCGCVMIDYGREVLGFEEFACGYSAWEKVDSDNRHIAKIKGEQSIFDLLNISAHRSVKTYGEIKQKINEKKNN